MQWKRNCIGLAFIFFFVVSYITNKFVLSVMKFTYPTLFQGWQTFIGAVLLLLFGKLGLVEMSPISRSDALSWFPGSLLFVGNIYAGSRALSRLEIPFFFTLQNSSHVVSYVILKAVGHKEKSNWRTSCQEKIDWLKLLSICLMLFSAIYLPAYDPQFDLSGYIWALAHLVCVGAYGAFKVRNIPSNLSDIEQQCVNYLFSVLLLTMAAHPTGDLTSALEFPSLQTYALSCGCCASALLGFMLLLTTFKLKSGLSLQHFALWIFLSKITAMFVAPLIFYMDMNTASYICVAVSHVSEAVLVYSEREAQ
ncbi:transmembrane protein 241-like isoform X1 [Entelurus aequoreus]|uniref:transmembrane protein 241-like isoform X1 n=2 Tax=Entelurus aequoreus TaxID=161455 RepID=UPI002B1DFA4A|nr:transmembrane protein 241-like isoform X1 [Entelurus aequoreus]